MLVGMSPVVGTVFVYPGCSTLFLILPPRVGSGVGMVGRIDFSLGADRRGMDETSVGAERRGTDELKSTCGKARHIEMQSIKAAVLNRESCILLSFSVRCIEYCWYDSLDASKTKLKKKKKRGADRKV